MSLNSNSQQPGNSNVVYKHNETVTEAVQLIPTKKFESIDEFHAEQPPKSASKIELVKEAGAIKSIVVHCSCGKVNQIDCQYG